MPTGLEEMATVYLFGAGASHGYDESPTGVKPPLAAGLFGAYGDLLISEDLMVKVGWLVNYVRDRYGVPIAEFAQFKMDAEEFMTGVEDDFRAFSAELSEIGEEMDSNRRTKGMLSGAVYDQTLFLFTHVLNEIANGPVSGLYSKFIEQLQPNDTAVTFNWDVLLDRALFENSMWRPDDGYSLRFNSIFEDGWRLSERPRRDAPLLLKLHGSTNWLTRYIGWDMTSGKRGMLTYDAGTEGITFGIATDKSIDDVFERGYPVYRPTMRRTSSRVRPLLSSRLRPLCFVRGEKPFETFDGRFRTGYEPFTYFYSPLDPDDEVPTSPLIVAPVRNKGYEDFESILGPIWRTASERIAKAERVCVIGFSFPPTDVRARSLFSVVEHPRKIEVIDPYPDRPTAVLRELTGGKVEVSASSFEEFLSKS